MPKETLKFSLARKQIVWIGLLLVLALAACSGATPTVDSAPAPSEPPVGQTAVSPEEPSANEAAEDAVAAEQETVDYCLDCHTDKQALIDTAAPEMEVIAENAGQG